jgi:hypothetical protein
MRMDWCVEHSMGSTHPVAVVELVDRGVYGRLVDAVAAERLEHLAASEKGGEETI